MVSAFERISKRAVPVAGLSILAAATLAAAPGSASAGRFHVYSCRMPSGESAPVDGWSGSKSGTYTYAEDTCSRSNGALVAALRNATGRTANTDIATWTLGVPANETLAGATLWRAGDADGGAATSTAYEFWFAGPENNLGVPSDNFAQCEGGVFCPTGVGDAGQPLSSANRLVVPSANLGGHLYIDASCVGSPEYKCPEGKEDPNGYAAVVYLFAADLVLEQNAGPSASGVSGELASAPAVSGTSDLAFSATDPGSGVYEAVFSVDGQVVQSPVLDENGGRCKDVGQTTDGSPAFLYLQPCLGTVSVDVGMDTTKVSNGAHHLVVSVLDAAGNAAPVLDREITVANPTPSGILGPANGPANGTNASATPTLVVRWRGRRSPALTSGYGRVLSIAGRLTAPGGVPISAAQIELHATPASVGAKTVALASPRTGLDGSFAVRLPHGLSSCTLRFAYRTHLGDALPAATRTLTLKVHAGITLSVAPRTSSVGKRIFFRGRLLGRPVPADGKQLVLEARAPRGSWIEFEVVRTDGRGRYHAGYRFRFPGPARYQFRVLSEPESDYPFAAGSSRVVDVREL
jgi:hypothetical protein